MLQSPRLTEKVVVGIKSPPVPGLLGSGAAAVPSAVKSLGGPLPPQSAVINSDACSAIESVRFLIRAVRYTKLPMTYYLFLCLPVY